MKAARNVLEYLIANEVKHIFGIPAGSVNAFLTNFMICLN